MGYGFKLGAVAIVVCRRCGAGRADGGDDITEMGNIFKDRDDELQKVIANCKI